MQHLFYNFLNSAMVLLLPLVFLAHEAKAQQVDSINMPQPDGYVEVHQEEFNDFVSSLRNEILISSNLFLRCYVKSEELHLVTKWDVDELSSIIIAAWFQPFARQQDYAWQKKSFLERVKIFNESALQKSVHPLTVQRQKDIDSIFKDCHTGLDSFTEVVLDRRAISNWIQKSKVAPQEDFLIGTVYGSTQYLAYSWLQSDNSTRLSYGIPVKKPVLITYVVVSIQDKKLGLIFVDRVDSVTEVDRLLVKSIDYVKNNFLNFSIGDVVPFEISEEHAVPLLVHAGKNALARREYAKATIAYKQLLYDAQKMNFLKGQVDASMGLSVCYLKQHNFQGILNEIEPILIEANKQSFSDLKSGLFSAVGSAYAGLGQHRKSEEYLRQGLRLACRQHGFVSEDALALREILTYVLLRGHKYGAAQHQIENVLGGYIELQKLPILSSDLYISYLVSLPTEKINLAVFYGKVLAGHMLFYEYLVKGENNRLIEEKYFNTFFKQLMLISCNIATDEEFQSLLECPNTIDDTPYNKTRAWMRGPEIELYAKYGEVASALAQAGKSGTESEKETARKNFQNWFGEVEKILGDK